MAWLVGPALAESEPTLLVFAGAGFRLPIEEAAREFSEKEGLAVETTFAGSGCLLAQAELAGIGDVFLPGEVHYLDHGRERGLVGGPVSIAYLRPVIAVRAGNPHGIENLADLGRPGVRVGLGDPESVAVGIAAARWIDATLAPADRAALRANVRTLALNVNELGSQLTLGALDAAVVWDATVPLFDSLERVPGSESAPFRTLITGGVLSLSGQPEAAARFLRFLAGDRGAEIFRRHGYEPFAAPEPATR